MYLFRLGPTYRTKKEAPWYPFKVGNKIIGSTPSHPNDQMVARPGAIQPKKQNDIIIDYVLQCHVYVHRAMRSQVVLKMSAITRDLPKTCYLLLRDGSYFAGECNLFVLVLFLCNSTLLS